jgi:ABC-type transport system involved in multi-copper enzyme maturation permease subunit
MLGGGTLALMTRSLRTDSRLLRHHFFRLLFILVIYCSVFTAHSMSFIFGAPGLWLFQWMTWLNFVFISLAGIGLFASVISEEKEEETLGLLKMAGVRPLSLLLGKSTSRLLTVGLLLSLQFPFTLLAITLGGVSLHQILAVYLALLAYIAMVANLALFWSVYCRRSSGAALGVFLLLTLFFIVPPMVRELCQSILISPATTLARTLATFFLPVSEWLCAASVVNALTKILATGFVTSPFTVQVNSNFAAAAGLFALSWVTFDRFTRDHVSAGPERSVRSHRRGVLKWLGPGRAWTPALVWKDFHFLAGGFSLMLAKLILYGMVVVLFGYLDYYWGRSVDWQELGGMTMVSALMAGGVELSLYSSRIFHVEIRWTTWPPLVMLPLSLLQTVASKVAGCLLALFPVLAYLALGGLLDSQDFFEALTEWPIEPWFWVTLLIFAFFLHLTALLTLFVKWGALPLAIGIMFFGYMFFAMAIGIVFMLLAPRFGGMSWIDENVMALIVGIPFLAANVGMEILMGLRLRQLAER